MRYAIVSDTIVVEAQILPAQTTNQQAELIALICVFQLAKAQSLNLYTDSKYAFHILLSYAAICKKCELLTTKGGSITNSDQIIALLETFNLPTAKLSTADCTKQIICYLQGCSSQRPGSISHVTGHSHFTTDIFIIIPRYSTIF